MSNSLGQHVVLGDELLIAKGRHRACYQHPDNKNYCIKIHLDPADNLETLREIHYFEHLHEHNAELDGVSDYIGQITTNLGLGYIYELIRDFDGRVSKTLDYYLSNLAQDNSLMPEVIVAYQRFKEKLQEQSISIMNLKTYNVVFKKVSEQHGQFYLIDNLGSANLIPLSYYFKKYATSMLKRKFLRFECLVKKNYQFCLNYPN